MLRLTSATAVLLLILAASSSAFAQIPRYTPPGGPTMPRALDYFRRDVGVLDPYNTFVAPRRQLDSNLRSLQAQEQYNTRQLQQQVSQLRQSAAAPTGTGGTFMNYSHYYPNRTGPRAVRGR